MIFYIKPRFYNSLNYGRKKKKINLVFFDFELNVITKTVITSIYIFLLLKYTINKNRMIGSSMRLLDIELQHAEKNCP